jgi:hypothetical protein
VPAALMAIGDRDHRLAAALFTPGAEWHNTSVFPGPRVCVGPDAIVHFLETLHEDFEVAGMEIEADIGRRRPRSRGSPPVGNWSLERQKMVISRRKVKRARRDSNPRPSVP